MQYLSLEDDLSCVVRDQRINLEPQNRLRVLLPRMIESDASRPGLKEAEEEGAMFVFNGATSYVTPSTLSRLLETDAV